MTAKLQQFGTAEKGQIILAHGAGAGIDHPFMQFFGEALAGHGYGVTLMNFPYMTLRAEDGKKRPPDRAPKLIDHFRKTIEDHRTADRLIIGGKSMGGRIASMLVAEDAALADGLLVLGYPFHPPGKPEKLRTDHFPKIKTPSLILQGERDTFGGRDFAEALQLPANMKLHWVPDGDHSFKPRKASGRTELENWKDAATAIAAFPW